MSSLLDELERRGEPADLDRGVRVLVLAGAGAETAQGAALQDRAAGAPLDPRVIAANHDPAGPCGDLGAPTFKG